MSRHTVQSLFPDIVADKYAGPLPLSVQTGTNADLVHQFRDIYFPDGKRIVDLTYGDHGGWWKRHRPDGLVVSDHDFTDLPYADGGFDTVCYDPPYVETGGKATTDGADDFRTRFGIQESSAERDLLGLMKAGANEAARVTSSNGYLVVKCMDFAGSNRFNDWAFKLYKHMTDTGENAAGPGMLLHDEIVHNAGTGPGGHNIETPKRARRSHSKMLVFTWTPR